PATLHSFPTRRSSDLHIHHWNTATQLPTRAETGWQMLTEQSISDYVAAVAHYCNTLFAPAEHRSALRMVYTPLHGVGAATFDQLDRKSTRLNSSHVSI